MITGVVDSAGLHGSKGLTGATGTVVPSHTGTVEGSTDRADLCRLEAADSFEGKTSHDGSVPVPFLLTPFTGTGQHCYSLVFGGISDGLGRGVLRLAKELALPV